MPRTKLTLLLLVTAAGGCGTGGGAVKPDEMSATQHRDEAARENEAARQHRKDYDPQATVPSPFRPAAGAVPDPATTSFRPPSTTRPRSSCGVRTTIARTRASTKRPRRRWSGSRPPSASAFRRWRAPPVRC